jgi:acetyl esterase
MDERLDPEMRAAKQRMDAAASELPPVTLAPPIDASRAINDRLNLAWAEGGPTMAKTTDHFVFARGRRVMCRMHRPSSEAVLPVLIWFHGGGWVWSSLDTHDRLVREYAAASGIATINVDYALSPEAKFPQALFECADVVRAISAAAAEWGIDPARIVVGGDSAGGNLALATALLLRDSGGPVLRGILTPYPVTSADFTRASYREFSEGYGLTRASMMSYWSLYTRDEADRLNPLASPIRADLAGLPPVLIQTAELDVLRDEGLGMGRRLQEAGVATTIETCPGVLHGFMRLSGAVTVARDAIARAGTWLRAVTA